LFLSARARFDTHTIGVAAHAEAAKWEITSSTAAKIGRILQRVMQLEPKDLLLFARVVDEAASRSRATPFVPGLTVSPDHGTRTALGEALILRNDAKLTVTEIGQAVLEHAHQCSERRAAGALADNAKLEPGGRLRVTMATDLDVMAPFLANSWRGTPRLFWKSTVSARFRPISSGENFDVALRLGLLETMPRSRAVHLRPVRRSVCVAAYLKECGTPRDPDALLAHHAVYAQRRTGSLSNGFYSAGNPVGTGLPAARVIRELTDLLLRMASEWRGHRARR